MFMRLSSRAILGTNAGTIGSLRHSSAPARFDGISAWSRTDNESGSNTIYLGVFIAYITFRALKEKGRLFQT